MARDILSAVFLVLLCGFPLVVSANPPENSNMENRLFNEKAIPQGISLHGLTVTGVSEEGILSLDQKLYMISRRTKLYDQEYKPISLDRIHIGDVVDIEYIEAQDMEELSYKKGRILLKLVIKSVEK